MSDEFESALLIAVTEVESTVQPFRMLHDSAARRGIPPHVTVLYPFRHPDSIDDEVLTTLRNIVGSVARFSFVLDHLDTFESQVLFAHPSPEEPFQQLTGLLFDAFSDCPPYGGKYPDLRPHLTIAHADSDEAAKAAFGEIADTVSPALPISSEATEVLLMSGPEAEGPWSTISRFPLGPRS